MTQNPRKLILFCVAMYLLAVLVLCVSVRRATGGHVLYALDDAYIHLALAENLAHGHYGINPGEYSSPSSSVLWPFLLIPFAGTTAHRYMPLVLNLVCGIVAAGLIGWVISRWPPQTDEQGRMAIWKQRVTAVLLLLIANLAGLTLIGMEHTLQVLLSICCAFGVMEALSEREIPMWCLLAAAIAPAVRYEDFSLTLAMCLALVGQRMNKRAGMVLAAAVLPVVAFSAFLMSKGLPMLPMSVLVKGGVYTKFNPLVRAGRLVASNLFHGLHVPDHFPMVIFFLMFASLAWKAETRLRKFVFAGVAALAGLQLALGQFGWFHRYEVYAMIFMTMLTLRVLAERPRFTFAYFSLGLVFCATPYVQAIVQTRDAAAEIYGQQFQMHRFVTEFYRGNYAVNDLGLTSFQRTPGVNVLDVYGLASAEASRQTDKSAGWLEEITRRHDASLAILFPQWFHIPASWTPIAKMCEAGQRVVTGGECVVFYSTGVQSGAGSEAEIRADLVRFSQTLPGGVIFQFDPPRGMGGYPIPQDAQGTVHGVDR